MTTVELFLNETSCTLYKNKELIWSSNERLSTCAPAVIEALRPLKASVTLILDHFWIKQTSIHLEDISPETKPSLLRAHAAHHLGIPEELVTYTLTREQENNGIVQGTLFCANQREIHELVTTFQRQGITIQAVHARDLPEYAFYDRKKELFQRARSHKKVFMVMFSILLIMVLLQGIRTFSHSVNAGLAQYEVAVLVALKENKDLHAVQAQQSRAVQFKTTLNKQRSLLQTFLTTFPRACTGGVFPQKVDLNFEKHSMEITGVTSDAERATGFVERLQRSIFPTAGLGSVADTSGAYTFTVLDTI